jgi:hypothetical protein
MSSDCLPAAAYFRIGTPLEIMVEDRVGKQCSNGPAIRIGPVESRRSVDVENSDRLDSNRIGIWLGALQFVFALSWTVYALYLPQLADGAGIDRRWVPRILLLDQAIFTACDWAMGIAADRVARTLGRIGRAIAAVTGLSTLAFLLLPFVAPSGMRWPFVVLLVIWSAGSSALRAPPLVLLGKHAAKPSHPWLVSMAMLGLGLAGAASPYLTVVLRGIDPRVPFVVASMAVMAVTLALASTESASAGIATYAAEAPAARLRWAPLAAFFVGIALLAVGFQVHVSINAVPAFLKISPPERLSYLMPVFWIGFGGSMLLAPPLCKRFSAPAVVALGALAAAGAAWAVTRSDSLDALVAAQFVAGSAWGCVVTGAFAAALAFGRPGQEGKIVGIVFSLFALAAVGRIALVELQLPRHPTVAALLPWTPTAAWLLGGIVILIGLRRLTPLAE